MEMKSDQREKENKKGKVTKWQKCRTKMGYKTVV